MLRSSLRKKSGKKNVLNLLHFLSSSGRTTISSTQNNCLKWYLKKKTIGKELATFGGKKTNQIQGVFGWPNTGCIWLIIYFYFLKEKVTVAMCISLFWMKPIKICSVYGGKCFFQNGRQISDMRPSLTFSFWIFFLTVDILTSCQVLFSNLNWGKIPFRNISWPTTKKEKQLWSHLNLLTSLFELNIKLICWQEAMTHFVNIIVIIWPSAIQRKSV